MEYGAYDFRLGVDEIDYIRVRTNDGGLVDSGYIDSLYYSWDPAGSAHKRAIGRGIMRGVM